MAYFQEKGNIMEISVGSQIEYYVREGGVIMKSAVLTGLGWKNIRVEGLS